MLMLLVIMNALFGLSFTLGKIMLSHGTPLFLVAVRMITSGLALLGYNSFVLQKTHTPRRVEWYLYLAHACFGIFGFYALRGWSLQFVSSSSAATVFAFFPLSTACISWIIRGTKYSFYQIIGLMLGCLGVILVLTHGNLCFNTIFSCNTAEMVLALSVIFLSIGIIILEELVTVHNNPPLMINGITMTLGGILALIAACILEPVWIHGNYRTLLMLLLIQTLISNCICANLQAHLLRSYNSTTMSCSSFLAPLSTILYGTIFLAEPFSWGLITALFVITCGIFCYHFEHIRSIIRNKLTKQPAQSQEAPLSL